MHPLSPSHQTWFTAYETYLRQKTLVDASRKRLLSLARRYLHYLDTEYPGIEATRISYPQCCTFLQTLGYLKVNTYNLYLVDLRGFLQFLEKQHGAKVISHQLRRKTAEINLPQGLPLDLMQQLCTPKATEAQPGHHRVAVFYRYACLRTVAAARRGFFSGPGQLCRGYGQARCGSHHLARQACCCRPATLSHGAGAASEKGRSCLAVSRQKRATAQI